MIIQEIITYREKSLFQFQQIPYGIKVLITEKCLEKNAGPYYIIPAFKIFNERLGIQQDISLEKDIEIINPGDDALFTEDDVFRFYINSNGKPKPGKGTGEKIDKENVKLYGTLNKYDDWRKKLSNEYESTINIDGKNWLSVESYYQASKFKKNNPDFYAQFSLDSNNPISKSVELAKAAGSKTGKSGKEQIRPKNISIDPDFYQNTQLKSIEDGLNAKFSQNEELKNILLSTKKAKLQEYRRKQEPKDAIELMKLREKLNTFTN